jgi:hypothetical protein
MRLAEDAGFLELVGKNVNQPKDAAPYDVKFSGC